MREAAFHYDPSVYERETIEQLSRYYETLLEAALRSPMTPVGDYELLSEADRERQLVAFNATAAEYPQAPVHERIAAQAQRWPSREAVRCGAEVLSYAELNERANQLAHYLRGCGVGPGSHVGLYMDRSIRMVVGLLGVLKAGGVYVPLSPANPSGRLAHQIKETDAALVLTEQAHAAALAEQSVPIRALDDESWLADQPVSDPEPLGGLDDPAYVIYTSGSTGQPKGVVITQRSLANYSHSIYERLGLASDESLSFATVSTLTADLGYTCLFPALLSGGCLHVLGFDVATDAEAFARYAQAHPIDVLKIVPSHLAALLSGELQAEVLPRRYLILGGEALSPELLGRIEAAGAGCEVINHYGPTEATVGCLMGPARSAQRWRVDSVPIGRPLPNTEIYILDAARRLLPPGVAGELYIGGAGLAQGYLNQPERTAERFVTHPFSADPAARLYRTGDRARYLPDATVEFLGRTDHQVKLRGFRVELAEIESVMRAHAGVREAVVLLREDAPGHQRLVGYVVGDISTADLQQALADQLPEYMLPSAVIRQEKMPLTANGKVDRSALPSPEEAGLGDAHKYLAPRNETEQLLANIFAEVLGQERVGVAHNFFTDLGGDSILGIQIVARANQAGIRLRPKQLFDHQTIAELAAIAEEAEGLVAEQGLVTGHVPLTPIQSWFFEQGPTDRHHWNQAFLFEVPNELNVAALSVAITALVRHHDTLRLRFSRSSDGWVQTNTGDDAETRLYRIDLSAIDPCQQRHLIESSSQSVQAGFDLEHGPIARFVHFDLGSQSGRLLIAVHHLAIDGISWRILLEDLHTIYRQLEGNSTPVLPPKTSSFKDWSEALIDYVGNGRADCDYDYWIAANTSRIKPLPIDHADGANSVKLARSQKVSLTEPETSLLLRDVPQVYHTEVNDVLLTALALALSKWTNARLIPIELEGHGREEFDDKIDVTRTVGWFTTHYPICFDLGPSADLGVQLVHIKEQLRAIPNRGFTHGLLRYLSLDDEKREKLANNVNPEVAFNYLGQFDQVLQDDSPFQVASESAGQSQSPRGDLPHRLYVSASVSGGVLSASFVYSAGLFGEMTMTRLAQDFLQSLRELIEHCVSTESSVFTPSDFPLANLDTSSLDKVSALLEQADQAGTGAS